MSDHSNISNKERLLNHLVATAQELSPAQIAEVADFAATLRAKGAEFPGERGSEMTIIDIIKQVGPLEFEPGELEALLAEIEKARDSELEENG